MAAPGAQESATDAAKAAKSANFDRSLRALFTESVETLKARYGAGEHAYKPELICLGRYKDVYEEMQPHEHYAYFETLYNRYRQKILAPLPDGAPDGAWLLANKVVVQFGEGTKGLVDRCKQYRIQLSDIYRCACDVRNRAEGSLDAEDAPRDAAAGKDLIRPEILLLHLLRLFYYLCETGDKPALAGLVARLEKDLHVPESKRTQAPAPEKAPEPAAGAVGNLFGLATQMLERMGVKPPEGLKAPTDAEINNVLNNVMSHQGTQDAIQKMFSSLKGCTDFGSAVQTIVSNVSDPTTIHAIQSSVGAFPAAPGAAPAGPLPAEAAPAPAPGPLPAGFALPAGFPPAGPGFAPGPPPGPAGGSERV